MIFKSAPDDPETQLYCRQISENGLVEVGIFVVMFGFRVRAGFVGDWSVELDWCGGANYESINELYNIALAILRQRPEDRLCFAGIPRVSQVKPWINDKDFAEHIKLMAGHISPEDVIEITDNMLIDARWTAQIKATNTTIHSAEDKLRTRH